MGCCWLLLFLLISGACVLFVVCVVVRVWGCVWCLCVCSAFLLGAFDSLFALMCAVHCLFSNPLIWACCQWATDLLWQWICELLTVVPISQGHKQACILTNLLFVCVVCHAIIDFGVFLRQLFCGVWQTAPLLAQTKNTLTCFWCAGSNAVCHTPLCV